MTLAVPQSPPPAGAADPGLNRVIAALSVTQIIGWGTLYYPPSILATPIGAELGLSKEVIFAGITIMLMVGGLAAPRIGRVLDQNGSRLVMCVGSALATIALLAIAAAPAGWAYLPPWVLIGFAMPMALALATFAALTQVAGQAGARRAITILTLFTGITSTIFWPLTSWLEAAYGWRATLLLFAALNGLVALPLHALVLPTRTAHRARRAELAAAEAEAGATPPMLPIDRQWLGFALMAAALALHGVVGWGMSLHFIWMFRTIGIEPTLAVAIASMAGVSQVASRIIDFWLARHISPVGTGLVCIALQPLAILVLLAFGPAPWAAAAFIVLYSISAGIMTIVRATLPLALFGRERYGTWSGRLSLPMNMLFAVAPVVVAALIERTTVWMALWVALVCSLLAAVAMVALRRLVAAQANGPDVSVSGPSS